MKMKSTKKALLTSVLSLLLCCAMLVGTTFAWFTDSVESGNNVIKAGNLDVEFDYWNGTDWVTVDGAKNIFNPNALWEPGHAEIAYLKVSNAGSLALKYRMALNVLGITEGKTKDGQTINLAEYLNFGIINDVAAEAYGTDREGAIAAVTNPSSFAEIIDGDADSHGWANRTGEIVAGGEDKYFAVVVWMPTSVGNEANHDGVNIPSINLGLTVVATQKMDENDSFGDDYDKDAALPVMGSGVTNVAPGKSAYPVDIRNNDGSKIASGEIPAAAVADDATEVGINVEETAVNANITIAAGSEARTFDVEVVGLKDGNTELVKVSIRIEAGLNPDTVKLYHYANEIPCTYNPTTGYVTFESAEFSPFTVVYDAEDKYEAPEVNEDNKPKADVTYASQYVNTVIEWGNYGQWSPTEGLDSKLEAAFIFACPEEEDDAFDYWYCDFYVSLDRALGENQLFLGGNYGSFGWVGFHNGDLTLDANTEIGLLESVTTNPWTYSDIKNYVGEFTCGVGDVDDALEGATFTVKLRLTNPNNEKEYYDVNVVTYTFGGNAVIDGATVVNSAEDLLDAVENGDGDSNIVLGGDIDLNDLFGNP